jgi:hypothetical protein
MALRPPPLLPSRRPPRSTGHRQHGAVLQQPDRCDLERAGWRTTLEYRENHRRRRDGRLLQVTAVWHAEAERAAGGRGDDHRESGTTVIWAEAGSVDATWARLRLEAELATIRVEPARAAEPRPPESGAPEARVRTAQG